MALPSESVYFPSLDKCLGGEERLISWKVAYRALCDESAARDNAALEGFFADDQAQEILKHALAPFGKPGSKSTEEWATKTAPINVPRSASEDYDLEDIKKDALWLSLELAVEQLAALRVVLLEWQSRAQDQLLVSCAVPEQRLGSSGGNNSFRKSKVEDTAALLGDKEVDFGSESIRRDRQLEVFLEEQNYILKSSALLLGRHVVESEVARPGSSWIDALASKIANGSWSSEGPNTPESYYQECISAIEKRLGTLDNIPDRPQVFQNNGTRQLSYAAATFEDITTIMRLIITRLATQKSVLSSRVIHPWYQLVNRYGFLQELSPLPALRDPALLQCLMSVVSLGLLQLPRMMARLNETTKVLLEGSFYPVLPDDSWLSDHTCIKDVNMTLCGAALAGNSLASPAVCAWGLMTSLMRDIAKMRQELRESTRPDEGSSDIDSPTNRRTSSLRDSRSELSAIESRYLTLQDFDLPSEVRDDPPAFLLHTAVDQIGVYSLISHLAVVITSAYGSYLEASTAYFVRGSLFELVQSSMGAITYNSEVLEAILTVLTPEAPGASKILDRRLADRFMGDTEILGRSFVDQALARYPFELSPMLRLFTALSSASSGRSAGRPVTLQVLENLHTITVTMGEDFKSYVLDHEDYNTNSMLLRATLPLFVSRQQYLQFGRNGLSGKRLLTDRSCDDESSDIYEIPAGAAGNVIRESRPMVFKLQHQHSALEFLGLLLSTILPNSDIMVAQESNTIDRAIAAEIITLLSALIKASLQQENGIEEARFVLGRFGYALPNEQDIITVVGDIFESELLSHLDQSILEGSLELLIACVELLDTLTSISPGRTWSLLARSSLLGLAGGANALAAAVGATEVHTGQFRFLLACTRLFSSLLEKAITGVIKRNVKAKKAGNRFDSQDTLQSITSERTISTVLHAFQVVMLDAFQSLPDWRFSSVSQKCEVTSTIQKAFDTLLLGSYGLDMSTSSDGRLSDILSRTSSDLLDGLAPPSGFPTALQKFATVISGGVTAADDLVPTHERLMLVEQTRTSLKLLTTVLRIARRNDETAERAHLIARELQKSMPSFASLQAVDDTLKDEVFTLLSEIVEALDEGENDDSQSLLARLSPSAARSFLSVVSQLDRPLRDISTETSMWSFLSSIMSSKQQWFAMFLLTGALPKDRLKEKGKVDRTPRARSLLARALDQLSNITIVAPEQATSMLEFIASAQNSWVWATNEVRSHHSFIKNALDWLDNLQARAPNTNQELMLAKEHQMAAHLCDILAVNLHASLEIGDESLLKMLIPKLGFLRDHATRVDSYNRSLHKNLADNFERKFQRCDIEDFKRTPANPAPLGRDYFYDLDFATKILQHDVAWFGVHAGRKQGFVDEFAGANINISLVEAQRRLLASWNVLATTLCEYADKSPTLRVELAQTALSCLTANVNANWDQPGMDAIVQIRVDMAFVIISKLVAIKADAPEMKDLLSAAWDFVRHSPVDYEVATSVDDLQYYRTSLQTLYLAIQPHIYGAPSARNPDRQADATDETKVDLTDTKTNACAIEIVARVVAPGFRALCGNLHNNVSLALPGDFALITALLQAVLSIHGVAAVHPQIAEIVASTSIIRGALSLYSWADQLAEFMDHDPIYGEIAIVFLLELSTVRPIAEHIALDRALAQLSSANLSNYFRKPGGKGPFDQPQRMFSIWSEGLLPLCLNLLDAVGAPIAAEVSFFLNNFPVQLERAQTALENREPSARYPHAGAVTLGLVSEAHSLCLIGMILSSDTARGAAEGIDAAEVPEFEFDYAKVREDAGALVRQKTSLAARIMPVGERETDWASREVAGPSDNFLQAKVVRVITGLVEFTGEAS